MRFASILILVTFFLSSCVTTNEVDLIIHNATIYAVDEKFSVFEAMAIRGDSIVEIGPEHQILNKYKSSEKIDAAKKFIYPGFIDAHSHFLGYAENLNRLNLINCQTEEEMHERLLEFKETVKGKWIIGRGWDQNLWPDQKYPTKDWLDENLGDYFVLLKRVDGHAALVNQALLDMAGISSKTKIDGGEIFKTKGKCNGILTDNAVDLINEFIPETSEEDLLELAKKAQYHCFSKGLTSVADAGVDFKEVNYLRKWHAKKDLQIKLYLMLNPTNENFNAFLKTGPYHSRDISISSFKVYSDGALGSRGACLLKPYDDEVGHHGFLLTPLDSLRVFAERFFANNFQMNTHSIGDSANRVMLQLYASILNGNNDRRWRIEHAQVVNPDDYHLFNENTVIPSVQPTHATSDMPWAEQRLGKDRIKSAYAYKTLLNLNGMLALGTDFPVEDIDPLKTFLSAVRRTNNNGSPRGGYFMDEALTAQQCLRGMTIWAALANFEEGSKGSLEAGKKADFIIMNRNLKDLDATNYNDYQVLETFLNGKSVYKSID